MGEIANPEVPELFQYTRPELPDDCIQLISPSQIDKFFQYPRNWYEENMLGNKPSFQGSTSTVTGTICHYIYEQNTLGKEVTREWINKQLDDYLLIKPNPDVDADKVKIDYPVVASAVMNEYVIPANKKGGLIECEKPIVAKVMDGIYIAGTCDRIEGDCVVDYKTVSTKPNDQVIPFGYKIQMLTYAYALRQLGYEINRIRLVYGVKPTKTIPARCVVVTESIDYVAEKLVSDTLKLIGESVLTVKEHPELAYLIFKSMDLKEK